MQTLRISCFLLTLLYLQSTAKAQDKLNIKFGKVTPEDFNVQSILIDSSTNAVVVADVGKSVFIANTTEASFSLEYTEKKRIKIFNKNGFDAATITIPLYVDENNKSEKLENLVAFTFNLENGNLVQTKVDKSLVFTENHSKGLRYIKFTFPALKEGSLIEYSYQINSDFIFSLRPWIFQGDYPVMWSQYEADIPEFFRYAMLMQGYQPFFINKVENEQASFEFIKHSQDGARGMVDGVPQTSSFKVDGQIDHHIWCMKNIPCLKEESYTTTLRNQVAKIDFQLSQVAFPHLSPTNYMNSWEKIATDLMLDEKFGREITRPNNWLDNELSDLVKPCVSEMDKAQKIYEFVANNFICNENNSIYIKDNLRQVFKNRSGSASDINMLLIAMLKNQKIKASPIILSTRDHGFTHELYPLLVRYNYLIAELIVDDTQFFLDASVPKLAFGKLPANVYNGQARKITADFAAPIYFSADSLKETTLTNVSISNMDNGNIEGSFNREIGFYESLKMRNLIAKDLLDNFTKKLKQKYSEEVSIDNVMIDSLKLLNKPVAIKFDVNLTSFSTSDIVYFNPMLGEEMKVNPFNSLQRLYPVEMSYTNDDIYNLTMEMPKGYRLDELPKSVRYNLNENEGFFEYLISASDKRIQMRCRLKLNKATYLTNDYSTLRDFYAQIVKKESEQIVFKKIR